MRAAANRFLYRSPAAPLPAAAQPAGAQNAALSCAAYPTLLLPAQGQPPELGLSLGRDRRYIIRDFSKLSSDFAAGATVAYGKRLTLTHRWEVFDPLSQQLLRLVIAKQEELSRAGLLSPVG